ncbi:MAG: hypothetical protein AAF412_05090 [Pseudomonadota bacterium]
MNCRAAQYLARDGEHLVLEGYRRWCSGVITGNHSHWKIAEQTFTTRLGKQEAGLALDALRKFTQTLGCCASCPLKTSPAGCQSLCRDEVMILGLLSGIQHGEQTTIFLCLDALVGQNSNQQVLIPAEMLATVLHTLGKTLLPVPSGTIRAILTEKNSTPTLQ